MKAILLTRAHLKHTRDAYPLYASAVAAGFPSPADDYIEQDINLHEYLVQNPPATFFVRAEGDSMKGAGIFSGDILVVDRSREANSGNIVIAVVEGELTVKRIFKEHGVVRLDPENTDYPSIAIDTESELTLWGVVSFVLHKC